MGLSCVKSSDKEDAGANQINRRAVGANQISDDQLDQLNINNGLTQKLMLTFSCTNLPNLDKASKSDAFCVLWEKKGNQRQKKG